MNQSQKTKGIPENLRQPIQNYSMDKKLLGIIWFGGVMTSNLKKKKNSQNDLRQYLLNFDGFTARELPGQNHVSLIAYPTTRRSLSHTSLPMSI